MVDNVKVATAKADTKPAKVEVQIDAKTRVAVNRASEGLMTITLEDKKLEEMPKVQLSGSKGGLLTVNTGCGKDITLDKDTSRDLRGWAELLLQSDNKQTTATTRGYVAFDLADATRTAVKKACAAER